jgi:hypothetical protein
VQPPCPASDAPTYNSVNEVNVSQEIALPNPYHRPTEPPQTPIGKEIAGTIPLKLSDPVGPVPNWSLPSFVPLSSVPEVSVHKEGHFQFIAYKIRAARKFLRLFPDAHPELSQKYVEGIFCFGSYAFNGPHDSRTFFFGEGIQGQLHVPHSLSKLFRNRASWPLVAAHPQVWLIPPFVFPDQDFIRLNRLACKRRRIAAPIVGNLHQRGLTRHEALKEDS